MPALCRFDDKLKAERVAQCHNDNILNGVEAEQLMRTYVASIGGKAVMAFRAEDKDQARSIVDDDEGGMRSDLKALVGTDGTPLVDGQIRHRAARGDSGPACRMGAGARPSHHRWRNRSRCRQQSGRVERVFNERFFIAGDAGVTISIRRQNRRRKAYGVRHAVLAASPTGANILLASPDGTVALYTAAANTFVNSRKDLSSLSGAFAASDYGYYVVGNLAVQSPRWSR